jgi:plasmid stabilization system protein ParE
MIVFRQRFLKKAMEHDRYLRIEFGENIANKFLEKVNVTTKLLFKLPDLGRKSKVPGVRSKLIPPYVRIYYSFKKGKLVVLNMYDMRQSPKKNIYE